MHFRKLFQLLVVGGAVMGAASGCTRPALAQQSSGKKTDGGDGASASGDARPQADAGVTPDAGGGVSGW